MSFVLKVLVPGPFVMNTEEEIVEAMKDYQLQQNGFENALTWNSFVITADPSTADLLQGR